MTYNEFVDGLRKINPALDSLTQETALKQHYDELCKIKADVKKIVDRLAFVKRCGTVLNPKFLRKFEDREEDIIKTSKHLKSVQKCLRRIKHTDEDIFSSLIHTVHPDASNIQENSHMKILKLVSLSIGEVEKMKTKIEPMKLPSNRPPDHLMTVAVVNLVDYLQVLLGVPLKKNAKVSTRACDLTAHLFYYAGLVPTDDKLAIRSRYLKNKAL